MEIFGVLIAIVVIIVIFLVCRELICWYWKINESLAVLTEVRTLLTRSVKAQERMADALESARPVPIGNDLSDIRA